MSKHTPGTWLHGWNNPDGLTGPRCAPTAWLWRQDVPVQEPIHVRGRPVAWVLSTLSDERAEADARLIAAAPELLEACMRMIGSLGVMVGDPDNDGDIKFARAAIEKATGVSQ